MKIGVSKGSTRDEGRGIKGVQVRKVGVSKGVTREEGRGIKGRYKEGR